MPDFRPALSAAIRTAEEEGTAWFTWPDGSRLRLVPVSGPHAEPCYEQQWVIAVYHSHFVLGCHAEKDGGYLNMCVWLEQEKLGARAVDCIRFAKNVRALVVEGAGGKVGDAITEYRDQWEQHVHGLRGQT